MAPVCVTQRTRRSSSVVRLLTRFFDQKRKRYILSIISLSLSLLKYFLSFPCNLLLPLLLFSSPSSSFSLATSYPLFSNQWTGETAVPTPPRRQHKDLRLRDAPINMLCPVRPYFYLLHSLLFHSVLLSVLRNPTNCTCECALFLFIRTPLH